ncbi:thioredoxin [Lysobacter sp. GX 14042]|uniref:thioredoxin n=1 Tax=Lysobacter sp. GX 14042 TaxID=2907155 RepID=UPI001EFFA4FE|nr:thioredoxin [Lysobacter sp. GX 14042]MCE7033137.1 thioredoxin [Lysobacter sp. GX 14042]
MTPENTSSPHILDVTTEAFEAEVLQRSLQVPVLVDFWAEWCGPCKQLGPVLEKLAGEYNGGFVLAKVDVDAEPQVAAAFQVRSIPTVFLLRGGEVLDGFPGVAPEGAIREMLQRHGIEPAPASPDALEGAAPATPPDPVAEAARLRAEAAANPDNAELRLDLALALLQTGDPAEAAQLLDGLPANLATDDRTRNARAHLDFAAALKDAPPAAALEQAIAADGGDLRARHLLGVRQLLAGEPEAALEQFIEMLRQDREFDGGLPRKALIDAFRVIDDPALVGSYRRKMSALLF